MKFDVIGDIAIIKRDGKIAKEILKSHKNIKTVLKKVGAYSGKYRLGTFKVVAGEKKTETVCKENGVSIKLDVAKCYFSERLSNERMRIAKQVKQGENVLVMFSGVGTYPLVIARHSKPNKVVCIEVNPTAHKYAIENCRRYPNIVLYKGDVRKVLPTLKEKYDRIIMPLPEIGYKFLDVVLKKIKKNGVIHLYMFAHEKELQSECIDKIKKYCKRFNVLRIVKCGQYAPRRYRVCVDFKV